MSRVNRSLFIDTSHSNSLIRVRFYYPITLPGYLCSSPCTQSLSDYLWSSVSIFVNPEDSVLLSMENKDLPVPSLQFGGSFHFNVIRKNLNISEWNRKLKEVSRCPVPDPYSRSLEVQYRTQSQSYENCWGPGVHYNGYLLDNFCSGHRYISHIYSLAVWASFYSDA